MTAVSDTDLRLSLVFPDLAMRWRKVAADMLSIHEMNIKVVEGVRTAAKQLEYWAKGRKKLANGSWIIFNSKLIVTHAQTVEKSLHYYGLALDSAFSGSDPYLGKMPKDDRDFLWSEYGKFCRIHGLEWGGDWKGIKNDRPHCQKMYGLTLTNIKSLHAVSGNVSVWDKCNQILNGGV